MSVILTIAGGLLFAIWLVHSFTLCSTAQKIVYYTIGGSYVKTVVNHTYFDEKEALINGLPIDRSERVQRALTPFNIAFGFWPFVLGFRMPTGLIKVPVHVGGTYTKAGVESAPRVATEVDAEWFLILSDDPVVLGLTFEIFDEGLKLQNVFSKRARDLTVETKLLDSPNGDETSPDSHMHKVSRVGYKLHRFLNEPTQDSIRTAATNFTWGGREKVTNPDGTTEEQSTDIIDQRIPFAQKVKTRFFEQEGSVADVGGLLSQQADGSISHGGSLYLCNLVVQDIRFAPAADDASEGQRAIDRPFIGLQTGKEQQAMARLSRIGQSEGIKKLMDELNINAGDAALLMDVLRDGGNVQHVIVGGDLQEAIKSFVTRTNP